ncbi:MAG TPA: VTT domain-containing protein [Dermatophilaceae bacterium]|nr:VTT domain-containing protein [Dermatophilaceae bacterium]
MHSLGPDWMDPNWLLDRFGSQFFWISAAIVFVECGLFFPLLPGDSLIFAIGLFIARGDLDMNPAVAALVLFLAAFLGNVVGYEIGRAVGRPLYERDGRIIKKKYFDQTHAFFDRHGAKALVIGRFVPIVRTYVTVVAGVSRMERRHFFLWSAVGAVLWAPCMLFLGYFLGGIPWLSEHLETVVVLIVLVSVVPMGIEVLRHRRTTRIALQEAEEAAADLREAHRHQHDDHPGGSVATDQPAVAQEPVQQPGHDPGHAPPHEPVQAPAATRDGA